MEQKPKKYFLIPLIIGICIFVAGLTLIIKSALTNVPPMSDSGWFDAETANSARLFAGIPICFFGVVIGVGVAIIVYHCDPVVKNAMRKNLLSTKKELPKVLVDLSKVFQMKTTNHKQKLAPIVAQYFQKTKMNAQIAAQNKQKNKTINIQKTSLCSEA